MSNLFILAQSGGSGAPQGNPFGLMIPMILLFIIMYVILIKPQHKKQKQHQEMVNKLKSGDKVITNGGIHGVIAAVKDQTVILKVADKVKVEVNRVNIAEVNLDNDQK